MKKRTVALLLACMMVIGVAAGGTIAWLTAKTESVVNTFTVGAITLKLVETDGEGAEVTSQNYKLSPGGYAEKDPIVTVQPGSEHCYLFVRVDEANNQKTVDEQNVTIVNYTLAAGWTEYTDDDSAPGTYYYKSADGNAQIIDASTSAQPFNILACQKSTGVGAHVDCDGCVNFADEITDGMISTEEGQELKLTFTAAAVQSANMADIDAAWDALPAAFKQ